ncbi:hypothetical protein CHGG_00182 [Chaetomium globosum CBS 148.51]|uniref:FAD-binding domain-containing protein n=1 Tax=Chaetomium globosum (strain ATCC 6205 / CBS 148.51 / DSM 1962 / NBRC 6347 / NRRL 1970) TaxID=306901 RepID=Q2HHX2_CHAGB|nr:uncharacterized protein CHGG_00182 [Chaetomium globosum CBS 148.51]EAQ91947.1 hypothetical protein CHGG_00182 [Chaetomium globosum CBS 148.51]
MFAEPKLRVLVVGASIAGPAAAYWLAKAGAKVTVIERFPELRTNGQNVDIRTVGVTVMRKIPGMEAAVRAKAVPMTGISFVDAHDRPFANIQATGNPDQQSLVSEYEILRGDLSQILFDLTNPNPNITYIFGEQIASLSTPSNPSDPVTVTFAHGRLPPQPFDLIVAADGAASRTRALGFNCSVHEHTHPIDAWAAYFTIPHSLIPPSAPTTGRVYNLPGGRFIGIAPTTQPGTTQVTLMRTHFRNANNSNSTTSIHAFRTAAQSTNPSLLRQYIADTFKSPTATPTTSTPPNIHPNVAHPHHHHRPARPPPPPHSMPPNSSNLALVGGYVLAGEIGAALRAVTEGDGSGGVLDLDLDGALRRYEGVMGPVVRELQGVPGYVLGVFAPQTRWGLWVRNAVLWFVCWSGLLGVVQRWLARAFGEGKEGALPEYEWLA